MPPKFAFWAGVITATAVYAVVGFGILLLMVVKGVDLGTGSTKTTKSNTNTAAAAANVNSGTTIAGKVDIDSLRNTRGEGSLTIVEYSDPECPFCKRFHTTLQQVMTDYDGKVAWSYKNFPLTSLHPKAVRESIAMECAADQDKFWEYTDLIYERTPSNNGLEDAELFTIATDIGLNISTFTDCVENKDTESRVSADAAEAQALGGTGTPFSVIIDEDGKILKSIPGALQYETVASQLDTLLAS